MDWSAWAYWLKGDEGQKRAAKRLGIAEGPLTRMMAGNTPHIKQLSKIAESRGLKAWQVLKEIEEEEFLAN